MLVAGFNLGTSAEFMIRRPIPGPQPVPAHRPRLQSALLPNGKVLVGGRSSGRGPASSAPSCDQPRGRKRCHPMKHADRLHSHVAAQRQGVGRRGGTGSELHDQPMGPDRHRVAEAVARRPPCSPMERFWRAPSFMIQPLEMDDHRCMAAATLPRRCSSTGRFWLQAEIHIHRRVV